VRKSPPASAKGNASGAELAQALSRIRELERELARTRAHIREVESSLAKAKASGAELAQARARVQELERVLAEARARIRDLEKGLEKAKVNAAELAQAGARIKDLEGSLASERARAGQSEAALAAARVRIRALEAALEKATGPNGVKTTSRDQDNGDGKHPEHPGSESRVVVRDWANDVNNRLWLSLTNPGTQFNIVGDVVNLPLSAFDGFGNALTFSASNLPPGLSIDTSTGIIAGSCGCGDYAYMVTVTATDATFNVSASQTFEWEVGGGESGDPGRWRWLPTIRNGAKTTSQVQHNGDGKHPEHPGSKSRVDGQPNASSVPVDQSSSAPIFTVSAALIARNSLGYNLLSVNGSR
jgi:hypothetical protein